MAIDNQFGKGIGLAAGFDLGAQKPLDSRVAVNTIAERDAHVTENRAYEGMIVFVDETKKNYQLINGAWQELTKAEQDRLDALEAMLNGGEGVEGGTGALGALQANIDAVNARLNSNGDIDNRIAQNASDIDALEKELADEIGIPSVPADENGEGAVQATGMHKVVEDSAAELRGEIQGAIGSADRAVAGEKSRAEAEEALIRQEFAAADSKLKEDLQKEIDDDVAAESALRVAEEARIEGKVDKEVQDRKDAVKEVADDLAQEIQDRGNAVQGVQDQIDAIKNEENGILAQAKALDKTDRDAQLLVDQEQDRRLGLLEAANAEGGAIKEAIDAAQKAADDAQDAADAAQADADALEQRLDNEGGLVDRLEAVEDFVEAHDHEEMKGRLDALEAKFEGEQSVDAKIEAAQAAAEAEAARLDGVLKGELQAEIDKKVAKADYDVKMKALDDEDVRIAGLVATEQGRAEGVEQAINAEIANMKDATKDGSLAKQIADEKTAREQADNGLDQRLQAVEEMVGLESGSDGASLSDRVAANEEAIEIINGEGEGSIKKAVADLVDGAPQDLDTLKELSAALRDNKDVLTAIETAFDDKLANEKKALQKEIDDDVKVVADELAKQKDASQEGTLAKQIADEIARADAEEKDIRADFAAADAALKAELQKEIDDDVKAEADIARAAEKANADAILAINDAENGILAQAKAHANGLDQAMNSRMEAVEGFVETHDHEAMEGRIEALENANAEGGDVAKAIKAAQDAADAAQADVDAVEKRLDDEGGLVDRLEAVEEFKNAHSHADMEQDIADNAAAIEVLNGDENKAGSVAAAVKVEADRAKLAEEAIQKQINEGLKCLAYDGDQVYTDLTPLA